MNNDSNDYYPHHYNHYNNNNIYINNNTLYVLGRLVRYAGKDRTMPHSKKNVEKMKE